MNEIKYTVIIRGPVPDDIRRKIAAAHAKAVTAARRKRLIQNNPGLGERGYMTEGRNP